MCVSAWQFLHVKGLFPAHACACSAAEKRAVLRTVTLPIPLQVHMCFISWLAHWTVNSKSGPAQKIRTARRLEEITRNKRQEWEESALSFIFFSGWMFPPMCLWVAFHLSFLFLSSFSFICPSDLDLGFPACSLTLQLLRPLSSCSLITEAFPPQQTLETLSCGPKRWVPFALGPNYSLSSSFSSSYSSSPMHKFLCHTLTPTFLRPSTYH